MRSLETLSVLANTLAFLVLAVPLPPTVAWLRLAAPVAALVAAAQVVVEGPRWQMAPAYALAAVFCLVWLLQGFAPAAADGFSTHPLAAAAAGLGVLGLAVSISLPVLIPVFRFPQPGGPYAIGTLTYHWVDAGRPELFTADPDDRRELMVQIWYPARDDPAAPRAPYVPDARVMAPLARLLRLPDFTFGHLKYVTTHAIPAAAVSDAQPAYPVLIFAHGRGGYRQHNTAQVEELVSHGYIVAAIDHPYVAAGVVFPDGRLASFDSRMYDPAHPGHPAFLDGVIPDLAQDALFTLDQLGALNQADPRGILTGRLDLQAVGMFGLSLGGATTAEACRLEPRLRACLVMDVFIPAEVVRSGLQQPTMLITRDAQTMQAEGWAQADIAETQSTLLALYEKLPGAGYFVRVPGVYHADFSDAPLMSPLTAMLGISGPAGGDRARRIAGAYSLAFFDRHLRGRPAPLLDGPSSESPRCSSKHAGRNHDSG